MINLSKAKINFILGTAMIGTAIIYNSVKKDVVKKWTKPSTAIEFFNKTYQVPLKNNVGDAGIENLTIKAELNKKTNSLYFGNYTQNYNRKDWSKTKKELLSPDKRHIRINSGFSRTFILHPKQVKVISKQRAYLIPKYKWDNNLKPYEEHDEAQLMMKGGEKIIEAGLSTIPIPFTKEMYDYFIKNSAKKEKKNYEKIFKKIKKEYTFTKIPSHIKSKFLGSKITAREYEISFNMSKTTGRIPMYLWAKIALGSNAITSDNEMPNKSGNLENIVVDFSIESEKEKKDSDVFPIEGHPWTIPNIGMEFVWIEKLNSWVGKYETTNEEYRKFEPNHDSGTENWTYNGKKLQLNENRQPVVRINYGSAVRFANWLTSREREANRLPNKFRYRLPTSNEWMTFSLCVDGREYPWGNNWPPPREYNYYWKPLTIFEKIFGEDDKYPVTAPVEKSGKNDLELFGVGGNVMEYTSSHIWRDGRNRLIQKDTGWRLIQKDALDCGQFWLTSEKDSRTGFRLLLAK